LGATCFSLAYKPRSPPPTILHSYYLLSLPSLFVVEALSLFPFFPPCTFNGDNFRVLRWWGVLRLRLLHPGVGFPTFSPDSLLFLEIDTLVSFVPVLNVLVRFGNSGNLAPSLRGPLNQTNTPPPRWQPFFGATFLRPVGPEGGPTFSVFSPLLMPRLLCFSTFILKPLSNVVQGIKP